MHVVINESWAINNLVKIYFINSFYFFAPFTPSHDNSKTSTRPGFVTRRSSYDHNLYKRDLYQCAYSYTGPNFRPDLSDSHTIA
ncbi:hypothetical protein G9A89_015430 [Geosiphon pyriformis]|nr:hypothetical protein G9A89_015430 [Geosiphon pyriformis]